MHAYKSYRYFGVSESEYKLFNSCEFNERINCEFFPTTLKLYSCLCSEVRKRNNAKYFIKPAKSSAEMVHSLHNPSVIRSSGVSVPRIAITTVCR